MSTAMDSVFLGRVRAVGEVLVADFLLVPELHAHLSIRAPTLKFIPQRRFWHVQNFSGLPDGEMFKSIWDVPDLGDALTVFPSQVTPPNAGSLVFGTLHGVGSFLV